MNRLADLFGRSGSTPSRRPGSPIMISLLHRRHLPAKHDVRVPDVFSTYFPSWMRVPATAVTQSHAVSSLAENDSAIFWCSSHTSVKSSTFCTWRDCCFQWCTSHCKKRKRRKTIEENPQNKLYYKCQCQLLIIPFCNAVLLSCSPLCHNFTLLHKLK